VRKYTRAKPYSASATPAPLTSTVTPPRRKRSARPPAAPRPPYPRTLAARTIAGRLPARVDELPAWLGLSAAAVDAGVTELLDLGLAEHRRGRLVHVKPAQA
jgi:hypothetical protein